MAVKKTTPATTFNPEVYYSVQLKAATPWKGRMLTAARRLELRGDVAEALKTQIADAQPV